MVVIHEIKYFFCLFVYQKIKAHAHKHVQYVFVRVLLSVCVPSDMYVIGLCVSSTKWCK